MSLIPIVREGKPIHDADLFIGKRYIHLVNFITELVPQKINKKNSLCTAAPALKKIGKELLSDFLEERGGCAQATKRNKRVEILWEKETLANLSRLSC